MSSAGMRQPVPRPGRCDARGSSAGGKRARRRPTPPRGPSMAELAGRRRFAHLFRRAGFGATPAQIDQAMAAHPDEDTAFNMAVDAQIYYGNIIDVPDQVVVDPNNGDTLIKRWLD